jgi:hypothetical protein
MPNIKLYMQCVCKGHVSNWGMTLGLAVVLGGLVVIMLPIGRKVRGFRPRRGRSIFKDDKNP